MKKSFPLLFSLLVCVLQPCFASDFIWFQTFTQLWKQGGRPHFLDGQISETILNSLDSIYSKTPQTYTFYETEGKLFVQVSCSFDLYAIQGDSLVNTYEDYNRGYTCDSHAFVREETNYVLGGQGFWSNHLDLLSFDELDGSWELQLTKNQPRDYFSFFVYQNSSGIVSLLGEVTNKRYGLEAKDTKGYLLDWKSKEWKELEIVIEGLDLKKLAARELIHFVQTQDYAFWASTNGLKNFGWTLIEKETGTIFYFPNKNVDMGISPYLEVVGNVLTYTTTSRVQKSLDLDQIRKQAKKVGYVRLKSAEAQLSTFWMYGGFVLLAILGGFWVKRVLPKKKREVAEGEPLLQLEPIQALLPYSGQELTTEQFDQLLELDSLANLDTRRMKRARLIKDINQHYLAQTGRVLVTRNKMSDDKRCVTYFIQG